MSEWHSPQPVVRSTATEAGASGCVASGFWTCSNPEPWQFSH